MQTVTHFTIEPTGPTDGMGRCQFYLEWVQNDQERGQVYFADPHAFAEMMRSRGNTVTIRGD